MKKVLLVIFLVSVALNLYLIRRYTIDKKNSIENLIQLKQVDKLSGLKDFEEKLLNENSTLYEEKDHFFIQTWDTLTFNFDGKYIYMQLLDSIAEHYKNGKIGFIFISEMTDEAINEYCRIHNMYLKNFIFVNDANDFISSIFVQKQFKTKTHPAQFIINKNGDIKYYKNTLFTDVTKDTILINNLNKFN